MVAFAVTVMHRRSAPLRMWWQSSAGSLATTPHAPGPHGSRPLRIGIRVPFFRRRDSDGQLLSQFAR
jgi:hypothetical protein